MTTLAADHEDVQAAIAELAQKVDTMMDRMDAIEKIAKRIDDLDKYIDSVQDDVDKNRERYENDQWEEHHS